MNIICVASYFKGGEFLRECKRQGAHVELLTKQKSLHENWPREDLDNVVALPDDSNAELLTYAVSQIARRRKIDCLVALEEFDVINTALVREHLRLPGPDSRTARRFRDKLTMRAVAHGDGIRVPEFVHALNYQELDAFMKRVPPPWVLKPRSDVSAAGIKKLSDAEQVWRAIDVLDAREALQDKTSYYLLERYVAGEVFHVDSLVEQGKVIFAGVSRYGRPPMDVAHRGGVFTSRTIEYDSKDYRELTKLNRRLLKSMGLEHGAAHAEFIKSAEGGEFYFLEVASRVGGAYIAETLEAASGVNLWREWARIELARVRGQSVGKLEPRREYGGIALSLARQHTPDTSPYDDPEISYRIDKPYHVGLVVRSPKLERVEELLACYVKRFEEDFCATAPAPERLGG
ncbi:MAG TPA: ATP-grasp domain-containing protein [Pyrinomonadaceae bacterium]|nr:ATP-grasp domain-containing protein [Pyrinomonadaceae bacterium]